jgi:hypothetical protein
MEPAVVAAIVAAVASVGAAVLAAVVTVTTSRRTQQFEAELGEQKAYLENRLADARAERDARRDYEYTAKKRLYEECEPCLFEASELALNGTYRIVSLARSAARKGIRPDGTGWLAGPGYYFKSTAYLLLAPLTTAKLLQRRLTTVDLGVEPRLQLHYRLLKAIYLVLADEFAIASREPSLPYLPDRADPGQPDRDRLLAEHPEVYRRQGLYFGTLDVIAESLVHEAEGRSKSFGEFLLEWEDPTTRVGAQATEIQALFRGFHPWTSPVLWRALVAQCILYRSFMALQRRIDWDWTDVPAILETSVFGLRQKLDWREPGSDVPDGVVEQPIATGFQYARAVLGRAQDDMVER